ncbi:MAG: tetratricopeptide repeat protein [Myxococcota bacterium]
MKLVWRQPGISRALVVMALVVDGASVVSAQIPPGSTNGTTTPSAGPPAAAAMNRCLQAFHVGDMAGARAACEEAARLDPTMVEARYMAGVAAAAQGDTCAARAHYELVLLAPLLHPQVVAIQQALASDAFQNCVRGVVAAAPSQPVLPARSTRDLVAQATVAFRNGDLDLAERLATQAVVDEPNDAGAHKLLAIIYVQRGLSCDAKAHYVAFLRLDPGSPLVPRVRQIIAHPDFAHCR